MAINDNLCNCSGNQYYMCFVRIYLHFLSHPLYYTTHTDEVRYLLFFCDKLVNDNRFIFKAIILHMIAVHILLTVL